MKATKRARIYAKSRTPLDTVIPRNTPYSIEVDVASICNLKCKFCFHSDNIAVKKSKVNFGIMDIELFKKIINDISYFPQRVASLKLFQFGEPLLNNNISLMIKLAKEKNIVDNIEIVTNGTLLNKSLNRNLVSAGLTRINISVESLSDQGYQDIAGVKIDFKQYVQNIRDFYENKKDCFVYIKLIDLGNLTEYEKEFFYHTFGDICDEIFIENAAPLWKDTAANEGISNKVGLYGQELEYKYVCPSIFTRMVINYDGILSLCCTDWKREIVIGDVKLKSLRDIWNDQELRNIQLEHLRGERKNIPLCSDCMIPSHCTVDDIDSFRDRILEDMTN